MANNIQNVLHINSEPVQTTSKARDLGVLVTNNLKWSSHISHIHSVTSHLSYIVLRTFSTNNICTLLKIYVTYIRPTLEYNSSVRSPYLKKDITLIESVQKRFTRNVFIRCNLPFNSYVDRLTKLGIKFLEYCRLEFDLILMYKISHNLCDMNFSDYFVFQTCDYNLRRHDFTVQLLFHIASRDQFRQFFFDHIVSTWNQLPDVVVSAFNLFKTKLKGYDLHTIVSLVY